MCGNENSSPTVLVADDSEEYREILSELLVSNGFRTICAKDGKEALEIVESKPIDLALLDVMMPNSTGLAVCTTIKSNPETCLIPVIIITGLNQVADRILGIEAGADDFLTKPFHAQELLARVQASVRMKHITDELESAETMLFSLALSIEAKDPYTEGHCERLAAYSAALGKRLGLPGNQLRALSRGGILHDIGKVTVPDHILLKPGPLSPEERRIMEQHPVIGERICSPLKSFRLVIPIIRHHHERMDGSGYPDGLKGKDIPLTARILTTVDIYDALTTDRPYRMALSQAEAFQQIRKEVNRGWWDSSLVEEFEQLLKE